MIYSWSKHVPTTVYKANKVLGEVKRCIAYKNQVVFSSLCKSPVRPILEYAAPIWSPYQIKDIDVFKKVQRRASRLALKQKLNYVDRWRLLKWQTLEKRREFLS